MQNTVPDRVNVNCSGVWMHPNDMILYGAVWEGLKPQHTAQGMRMDRIVGCAINDTTSQND